MPCLLLQLQAQLLLLPPKRYPVQIRQQGRRAAVALSLAYSEGHVATVLPLLPTLRAKSLCSCDCYGFCRFSCFCQCHLNYYVFSAIALVAAPKAAAIAAVAVAAAAAADAARAAAAAAARAVAGGASSALRAA